MKFCVIKLLAIVATMTDANTIQRAKSGWGSGSGQNIEIDLTGNVLATTLGYTGQASAEQQLNEAATGGTLEVPALIDSQSGVLAEVYQDGELFEAANVNTNEGSSSTINLVQGQNIVTGDDYLQANLSAQELVAAQASAATLVNPGGGVLVIDSSTVNNIYNKLP